MLESINLNMISLQPQIHFVPREILFRSNLSLFQSISVGGPDAVSAVCTVWLEVRELLLTVNYVYFGFKGFKFGFTWWLAWGRGPMKDMAF